MAIKYNTVTETVTAIQFTFDNVKEIYIWLGMKDVSFSVKNRILSGIITNNDGTKLQVQKDNYIVKDSKNYITIWSAEEFKKHFIEVSAS